MRGDGALLCPNCGVITRLCQHLSNCTPGKGEFCCMQTTPPEVTHTPALRRLPLELIRIRVCTEVSRKWPLGFCLCYSRRFCGRFCFRRSSAAKNTWKPLNETNASGGQPRFLKRIVTLYCWFPPPTTTRGTLLGDRNQKRERERKERVHIYFP